ncbi:hypothetical protein [Streptomyces sp. NPDC050287]|uniref:hypothetical protein n=1 Tax=Streptomyces sp. NPDC050287 TaxID=3365608 RepID=UPI0037A14E52
MNTERPDNDDADRSVEERGAGGSAEEPGAAGRKGVSGGPGAASAGASADERGSGAGEVSGSEGVSGAEEDSGAASSAVSSRSGASDSAEADADAGPGEAADAEREAAAAPGPAAGPASAAAHQAAAGEAPAATPEADSHPGPAATRPLAEEGPAPEPEATADERTAAAPEAGAGAGEQPDAAAEGAQEPSTAPEPSASQALTAPPGGPPAGPPATEILRDEHGEELGGRRIRRRSPAVVVAVAAAVLVVGGGGAYFATTAAEESAGPGGRTTGGASGTPGDGTPPPLALDGYSQGGGTNGIAPGEPNPYGVTYRAAGALPDGPDSAPVYRTGGQVTKDEAAGLAAALGADGAPVAAGDAWTVGVGDGTGPSLQVNMRAPGSWTFHRYSPGTDNCQSQTVCAKTPADPGGDPVSEAVARKAAAPVLKAVGQDDTKVDASRTLGTQRIVNADPVIGDLPTYGWTTDVIVGAQGEVVSGNGRLTAPVKGDTYPVLGAEETLALLNAAPGTGHRMGIGGCATPVPLKDRLEAPCGSRGSATATPAKETLTVEKAVFGLASHTVAGRPALVPSWLFDVRAAGAPDDYTVTYPAVDPRYLTSPSPQPTEPGGRPTAAPAPRDVQVDGYTAAGRELTVSFTGGMCADYKATASESGDKVTVKVTETRWPDKICILIAKVYEKTVQLDEPLGDRTVVGSDGKRIPLEKSGARLPQAPETSGAR